MMMKGLRNSATILGVVAVLVTAFALRADAQEFHPWQAFVGCWMPVGQETADGVLCFRIAGEGVEVSTVVAGQLTSNEVLMADGVQRTVETDGCTGSKAVEFSSDGRRAFTSSQVACENDVRSSSGLMAFVAPNRMVDVRSIEIGGEHVSWIQEYNPVEEEWFIESTIENPRSSTFLSVLPMRARAAQPIGAAEVDEAASRVEVGAVEMWVAVQPSGFDLDGNEILRLADSGIPASVIDVMVAVTYPDRFALSLDGTAATVAEAEPNPGRVQYSVPYRGGFRSYFFDPYFIPGRYRYNSFGYPVYGSYYTYGPTGFPIYSGYVPTTITVAPRPPSSQGRMVNGQGYSRNSSGRSAQSSGSGGGGSVAPSTSSSGASSGGGFSSGGGSSSSGSSSPGKSSSGGTSTGRTAQPRN
jgi:hypothetical protein